MRNFQTKKLTKELEHKALLLKLAGDPVRIRILCVLMEKPWSCVSDIVQALDLELAAVSHHLQLMQQGELLLTRRQGQRICYHLAKGKEINHLRQYICQRETRRLINPKS